RDASSPNLGIYNYRLFITKHRTWAKNPITQLGPKAHSTSKSKSDATTQHSGTKPNNKRKDNPLVLMLLVSKHIQMKLVMFSMADEYVPDYVDKKTLVSRLCKALGGAEKIEVEWGNHSLSNRVEDAVHAIIDFVRREGPKGWDDPWN
ncbi:hypothetical protein AKJ16_DCAP23455, partial [Drosera capensis]